MNVCVKKMRKCVFKHIINKQKSKLMYISDANI